MKKSLHAFLMTGIVCISISCSRQSVSERDTLALIPVPQEMKVNSDSFTLTRNAAITLDQSNQALGGIAEYLNEKISPATGFELPVEKHGKIEFKLVEDASLGDEGYQLKVKHSDILITANKPAGIFYGVQTLLQMFPAEIKSKTVQPKDKKWTIPCAEITDKPQFPWRGLMLDVSRHWFTKEEVLKYIDELAEYKMNVFHWHLTDDQGWRLEIKSLPKLTEVGAWRAPRVGQWWQRERQQPGEETTYGGFYTQEDVKEVLAYAAKRYVRVIPEIDVPGHSVAALVAYPELACMKAPDAVNVGNKFYGEDENTLCIGKDYTFEFMAKVLSWRGMEGGIKAAKAGHHVIMTPTEHCYLDLWQGEPSVEPDTYSMCRLKDSYSFNPVPEGVPAEMVLGGQGNLWAESIPTFRHAEYMTWPRGWALSEVLWSGPAKTDWEKFWPRVEKHLVRADQADINYARSMYNAIVSPYLQDGVLQVELGSEIAGTDIYYTFDNTDPDSHTPKYTEPLSIPKNATWLRIVTYRDGKPVGKVITLTTKELAKRAESDKRTGHGNLTVD